MADSSSSDGKFLLTAPRGSSERLALLKLDEIIASINIIAAKLDSDIGVTDDDYQAQLASLKTAAEDIRGDLLSGNN